MSLTVVDLLTPLLFVILLFDILLKSRRYPNAYEARDTKISLLMAFGYFVTYGIYAHTTVLIFRYIYEFSLFNFENIIIAWTFCFILDDLGYYIYHRVSHRTRWFWSAHVNHHSSQYFNYSTGFRQSWLTIIAPSAIFKTPLLLFGFPPYMIIACAGINAFYQFCLHNENIPRLHPWIEFILNTPSNHRVHHGINDEYLDKNFSGVFIFWDRLFGTYMPENATPRYGITTQLASFNLMENVFHEWHGLWMDFKNARGLGKLSVLASPPSRQERGQYPFLTCMPEAPTSLPNGDTVSGKVMLFEQQTARREI